MELTVRFAILVELLAIAVSLLIGTHSAAVEPSPNEFAARKHWADAWLDDPTRTQLPFSFVYDSQPASDLFKSWKAEPAKRQLDGQRTEQTITWTDPQSGLAVRWVATVYADLPAVEWVLYLRNTGSADTGILENIQALDARFEASRAGEAYKLFYAEGSRARITDFQPQEQTFQPGGSVRLSSFGGRPSDGVLPFFNVTDSGEGGVIIGVGWTGQWAASFRLHEGGQVHVQAGMERTHLRLHPGEEIRTPAILTLFWRGSDRTRGQNLLRRLLLTHYTPRPGGSPVEPPCAASPHAKIGFEQTNEQNMLQAIGNIASHRVPFDTWWIDAGWYTCPPKPNGWAWAVGNPDPDPARFPHGLKAVADAAHGAGLKFLLWFEPERVMRDTWLYNNHPPWLLKPMADLPPELRYQINDGFHLLNLGDPEARAWLKQKISGMIGSIGIDAYRNDFNLYPLYFWREGEAPDRQGMAEIRYVMGLYDFFDTLLREHPRLLLDTCASGGRRIDFEMLRRTLVLTRSDYLWDPIGQQCHTYGLAQWIPITGIGSDSPDRYKCRSGSGSHMALAADYYTQDPAVWKAILDAVQEHRTIKHLYTGDFYPLGPYSTAADTWMAWQFHRPDLGAGLVQAFRRQDSPTTSATYRLSGLDPTTEYAVTNLDDQAVRQMTGRDLMDRGLTIALPERPTAGLYTYRKVADPVSPK